ISSGQPSVAQASNFEFSHEQMEEKFYAPLDGKWYFFQEQLVDPFAAREKIASGEGELIKQPSTFEADTGKVNTYGTYIATVQIPKQFIGETLAIHIPYEYSAYSLYVDGVQV